MGPNNKPLDTHGQITIMVSFGSGLEIPVKFVIADVHQNIILGSPFLRRTKASIDFDRNRLKFQNGLETSLVLSAGGLYAVNNYFIPPFAAKWIDGFTNGGTPNELIICQSHVPIIAHTVKSSKGVVPMLFINNNPHQVVIGKNQHIGEWENHGAVDHSKIIGYDFVESKGAEEINTLSLGLSQVDEEARWKVLLETLGSENWNVTNDQKDEVIHRLRQYQYVFALPDEPLGLYEGQVTHTIPVTGGPLRQRPRPQPPLRKKPLREILQELLARGIISESQSPWASPITLVPKKDNTFRLVCDYRQVNKITEMDAYPIPNLNNVLKSIPQSKYFSTLDLKSGYHQIKLHSKDIPKTAMITEDGLYQFNVLAMGLKNASQTFMRVVNRIFFNISPEEAIAYLDDILVFGMSFGIHLTNLLKVLQVLLENNLKVHTGKCKFFEPSAFFLGHKITELGLHCTEDKLSAIRDYPVPNSPKAARALTGAFGFYRKFCKNYSLLAKPIYELTTKTKAQFKWTDEAQKAFEKLKSCLLSAPILAIPREDDQFILITDSCRTGIGCVLQVIRTDGIHPVAFGSHILEKSRQNYSATKLEMYAIVYYVQHFKHLLIGKEFTVRTDHRPLLWLHSFKDPPALVARWIELLSTFNFKIEYTQGSENKLADALSRVHENLNAITDIETDTIPEQIDIYYETIAKTQDQDADLKKVKHLLSSSETSDLVQSPVVKYYINHRDNLKVQDGVLYIDKGKGLKIIIPRAMKNQLLSLSHEKSGHRALEKVLHFLEPYYWIDMKKDAIRHIACCENCGKIKRPPAPLKAKLAPTKIGQKFDKICIDIVGPLPNTKRSNKYILTVMDVFTKFGMAFALTNTLSETIARTLVDRYFSVFGLAYVIHSDQGSNFVSDLINSVFKLLEIKHTTSLTYSPWTNQVERWHRSLVGMLTQHTINHPKSWDSYLGLTTAWYNASSHGSINGIDPFTMMFGHRMNTFPTLVFGRPPTEEVCEHAYVNWLEDTLQDIHDKARQGLNTTIRAMKKRYDKHARGTPFEVSDLVWVKKGHFEPHNRGKFKHHFKGPYRILQKESPITYLLQNLTPPYEEAKVHFNRLKKAQLSEASLRKYIRRMEARTIRVGQGDQDDSSDEEYISEDMEEVIIVSSERQGGEQLQYGEMDHPPLAQYPIPNPTNPNTHAPCMQGPVIQGTNYNREHTRNHPNRSRYGREYRQPNRYV